MEIVSSFYHQVDEDSRLQRSRHGQLEYAVTMHYVHRFIKPGAKVLEVGAGTGRYSVALAKEGMDVTAVELVESNLSILQKNSKGLSNIQSYQGDATCLNQFEDQKCHNQNIHNIGNPNGLDVVHGTAQCIAQCDHFASSSSRTTAWAAIPSPSPVKPSFSSVVALTDTLPTSTPAASATLFLISSM